MLARGHGLIRLGEVIRPTRASSKTSWRKWAKEVRSTLTIQEVNERVAEHLSAWRPFQQAEHVLTYLAFGSEISLESLPEQEKTFYVTRTWETDRDLTVHRLDDGLEVHPYGYRQPAATTAKVDPKALDLALVPGLCFDLKGTRLGYGRGYYDRLLPKLRQDVPLVGIITDALVVSDLPRDAFDVPMTHLVTETGVKLL